MFLSNSKITIAIIILLFLYKRLKADPVVGEKQHIDKRIEEQGGILGNQN